MSGAVCDARSGDHCYVCAGERRCACEHCAQDLARRVASVLSDDLRRPPYRGDANPLAGHCYVATEALFHLLGGAAQPWWRPRVLAGDGTRNSTHWFLQHARTGAVVDPTEGQFTEPVPHVRARACGFLTVQPSKRAAEVIRRVEAQR